MNCSNPSTERQIDTWALHLQPDDEIVIPQDDLYVITWETNFGDFQSGRRNATYEQSTERAENTNDAAADFEQPDQILTDVDLRSTRRDATEETLPERTATDSEDETIPGDETSSGGSDTIVPEVLESENDERIQENESPRGGKYNLCPNPTPNYSEEYRY